MPEAAGQVKKEIRSVSACKNKMEEIGIILIWVHVGTMFVFCFYV